MKYVTISLAFRPDQLERVNELSEEMDRTSAFIIRKALDDYLGRSEEPEFEISDELCERVQEILKKPKTDPVVYIAISCPLCGKFAHFKTSDFDSVKDVLESGVKDLRGIRKRIQEKVLLLCEKEGRLHPPQGWFVGKK